MKVKESTFKRFRSVFTLIQILLFIIQASCTLDASVKIYSNRVDDTYTSSHRILESLSRNGNNDREEDDGDDDNTEEAGPKVVKARVGTKANSDKLNLTSTIEKNVSLLNAVAVEHDYHVDPMFVKMSQAFDEGGAKGMLMYNMVSCSLMLMRLSD